MQAARKDPSQQQQQADGDSGPGPLRPGMRDSSADKAAKAKRLLKRADALRQELAQQLENTWRSFTVRGGWGGGEGGGKLTGGAGRGRHVARWRSFVRQAGYG